MKHVYYLACGLALLFAACESNDLGPVKKARVSGHVQKGPYVNGSSITIIELDNHLNQTGKNFATSIIDNSGSFEQKDIDLASHFIQLKADGYYFNEVSGKLSSGQLTLYALSDVSDASTVNVNVLTHLERARVEYLVQEKSKSFAAAKKQAQKEILAIFGFTLPSNVDSESLDLTQDAILLAISCILQGPYSTGDMVEIMASISADIRPDGVLDNQALGSKLMNNARNISLPAVRKNLTDKYAVLGIDVTIPDFESYVQQFLEQEFYSQTLFILYPLTKGMNILSDAVTAVRKGHEYSMKADVPEDLSLKIVVKDGLWYYLFPPLNWSVTPYDAANKRQEFTVTESGKPNELQFRPESGTWDEEKKSSYITIEYYENGANIPNKIKQLTIIDPSEVVECEFTDPLTDLTWLQEWIAFSENPNSSYYDGLYITKIYQCVYGQDTQSGIGFIIEAWYNPGGEYETKMKMVMRCDGQNLCVMEGTYDQSCYDFNIRDQKLIYKR
ncbi:MAG: hypothetical protein LBN18_03395 [Dysgonamonadaceae bacterium]|nr:hypothetical protein [Dysgonamonadaceae bacterium]